MAEDNEAATSQLLENKDICPQGQWGQPVLHEGSALTPPGSRTHSPLALTRPDAECTMEVKEAAGRSQAVCGQSLPPACFSVAKTKELL